MWADRARTSPLSSCSPSSYGCFAAVRDSVGQRLERLPHHDRVVRHGQVGGPVLWGEELKAGVGDRVSGRAGFSSASGGWTSSSRVDQMTV